MPRRNRLWALGSLGLVWMLLLSACGASPASPTPTPTEIAATAVPSPTPTPSPTIDEIFPYKSVWHFANKSGYTYDMTIVLGEPTRIPESGTLTHPLDRDFTLGSGCTVDPKLDIVIPAYWSAEATTVGFDTPIAMRALFTAGGSGTPDGNYSGRGVAPTGGDNRVLVEQKFSTGPDCTGFSSTNTFGYGGSDGFGAQWADPVPEGSVRTSEFFIVVTGYFSPATPQGDAALLDWIVLKPLFGGDSSDDAMVYRDTDGSGFLSIESNKGITLSGKVVDPSVPTPTPTRAPTWTPTTSERATSTAASAARRFKTGAIVVANQDGVVMHEGLRNESGSVAVLSQGTKLTILSGPIESDGYFWWQVEDAAGHKGWVRDSFLDPST